MSIKSMDELINYKNTLQQNDTKQTTRVLIGLGTCGIAAGAKDTLQKMETIITDMGLQNIELIGVGCVGFCCMEPTVEIVYSDKKTELYGPIKESQVEDFVQRVFVDKTPYNKTYIIETYGKVGE